MLPDLEIASVWARELSGGAPELREGIAMAATADAALPETVAVPIQRQLVRALCQQEMTRSAQGREPATSPALDLNCHELSSTLFGEEESPFNLAVREAASSWGLFQKLADAAQFLTRVCDAQMTAMSDVQKAAITIADQWIIPTASFATTFKEVKAAFTAVPPLRGDMDTIFDLEAGAPDGWRVVVIADARDPAACSLVGRHSVNRAGCKGEDGYQRTHPAWPCRFGSFEQGGAGSGCALRVQRRPQKLCRGSRVQSRHCCFD